MEPLQNIVDWNIDARREKNLDFFVTFDSMERVIDGRRSIIVGRRGTGKTALAKYISTNFDTCIINFDLQKFSSLFRENDSIFNASHEFSRIWRYIIISEATKKLYRTSKLDYDTSEFLAKIFDSSMDKISKESSSVKKIGGGFNIPGFGGLNGSLEREAIENNADIKIYSEAFEKIFKSAKPEKKIYIIFDEIDINFRKHNISRDLYINLVESLISAVLYVADGSLSNYIVPIVCVRDDIFNILGDERSKWSDSVYRLNWSEEKIMFMLAKRLKLATGESANSFMSNWDKVYTGGRVKNGSGKIPSFEYIKKNCQGRPRDYIIIIREAAREAIGLGKKTLDLACLENSLPNYSDHLLAEGNLELSMIFEEYLDIMPTISKIGKQIFGIDEFEREYVSKTKSKINAPHYEEVLSNLRDLSIIGIMRNNVPIFSYDSPSASTILTPKLAVHPGLRRSLKII